MGFLRCGLLASLLALAFKVHAGFVGVDYEHVATVDSLNTYRLYAVLDDDEDELIALYGDTASPWTLSLDGTLFQAADGGPLATSGTTSDMDSWFTIGSDGPGGTSSLQEVGMTAAWADFESGAGFTVNSAAGGTVFVFPGSSADALAGADGRVLIAQLTMTGTATLTLNVQWRPQGGLMIQEEGVVLTLPQEVGCMDPTACNYDAEALVDDGGCEYTTGDYYDCDGACVHDVDGDGICDELEVLGCTTPQADNYNPMATDDDGSCVAEGCTDATASNYVTWATVDDGSCYWLGCTDPLSLNFDAVATVDDGSCLYVDPSYDGLEAVLVEAGIDGWYIHRLYARFTNPLDELVAVFGDASTPLSIASALGFGQDPDGIVGFGGDDLDLPTEPDSWLALGSAAESVLSVGVEDAMAAFEAGDDFTLESPAGGLWYAWPGEGSGIPDADGRVLLGQFASQGLVTVELNLQYLAQSGLAVQETAQSLSFPDLPFGCTDAAACNYDATAQVEDGSCDYLACLGCTDIAACNYAETATTDDGTCTYPESGYGCDGLCLQDADGDGICDPFEVAGCTSSSAQNFNPAATDDDGSCEFLGCTNPISPNYDPVANVDDGTCLIEGCMDPDGLDYNPEATIPTPCTFDAPGYLGLSWSLVEGTSNTYRVYADFANALDQMVAVFGTAYLPLSVTSTSPFLSPPAAGILSSDAGADALGSWFTIGGAPGAVDLQSIGLDSAITSFMAGGDVTLNSPAGGMWFLLPVEDYDGSIGYPDSTGRVLLAQLVTEGQVDLLLNLQYQAPSGEMVVVTGDLQFPGGIPGCTDSLACNFDPNATLVLDGACTYPEEHYDCSGNCFADTDGDGVCDPLEVAGCTDSEAENFSAEATDDDGSCIYAGCTDSLAINFNALASLDDGSCVFDSPDNFCGGGTIWDPEMGMCVPIDCLDVDQDSVCDEEDDCVGQLDACGICNGPGAIYECGCEDIPEGDCDCDGNQLDAVGVCGGDCPADANGNGICDVDEGSGCADETACNFDPYAEPVEEPVITDYCLLTEVVAIHTEGDLAGFVTYRVSIQTLHPTDFVTSVSGNVNNPTYIQTTTSFYQHMLGGVTPYNNSPLLLPVFPNLAYDSWVTIGVEGPANTAAGEVSVGVVESPNQSWSVIFDPGNGIPGADIIIDDIVGGIWFIYNGDANGVPDADGRVLLGQFTTDGELSGNIQVQVFPQGDNINYLILNLPLGMGVGCPSVGDDESCQYDDAMGICGGDCIADIDSDGICDSEEIAGCTNPLACNYNLDATDEDGSCLTEDLLGICGGDCTSDADGDGVCDDIDDCVGTYDECGICNGSGAIYDCGCSGIPVGDCDCDGNQLDALGVCGGDCTSDADGDGVCDDIDDCVGTYDECGICNGSGAIYDCGCSGIPVGDCDCDGNQLDALGVCGGDCTSDADGDGVCDDIDDCVGTYDECGICNGSGAIYDCGCSGISVGDCDCDGNQLDALGVCGGDCTSDADGDGVCDDIDDCVGTYDECGICNGSGAIYDCGCSGIPVGDCDCDGNQLDALGVCGGDCTSDADGDGVCDDIDDCVGTYDECGICNGSGVIYDCGCSGIPVGDCDCDGNQLDALGVCGGDCTSDADGDGVCDDIDDCVGTYDECGICNGPGAIYDCGCSVIPVGDCDCDGNQLDALGVCGGDCTSDVDSDGICDSDEISGCSNPFSCNYDPNATDDDGSCLTDDVLGVCGGDCPADADGDGVCDDVDDCIGTYDQCGICNGPGATYDCGCSGIPVGDCDCDGNQPDALGFCGGDCTSDADGDGVCDDIDDCIGTADECDTCPEDIDGDGAISINDLLALLTAFASFCPE